jgi:hypothetical protein
MAPSGASKENLMKLIKLISALYLCAATAFGALPSTTVFEVRSGSSDTNGGGWDTAGTGADMSQFANANAAGCTSCQSSTANLSTTDAVASGTTITSATAAFTSAITGNIIYLAGGSGSLAAGWYRAAYVSATSITVDRTVASGSGITMKIGGALASPGQASAIGVSGSTAYVLNTGTDGSTIYNITAAAGSGGPLNAAVYMTFQGYTTNRTLGNTDPRPQLRINASSVTIVTSSLSLVSGFYLNGNSQTSARAANAGNFVRCYFTGFNTASGGQNVFIFAESTANSATVLVGNCAFCEAHANTATGIASGAANQQITDSLSWGNTGASSQGFTIAHSGVTLKNDIAHGNGQYGFYGSATGLILIINCHASGHTAVGGKGYALANNSMLINCSGYNNTAANGLGNNTVVVGYLALSASPFVNAAAGNFALNSTAGAGALLRAAGYPSAFPTGLTATYRDIGAAQHQDPATAGGRRSFVTVN